MRRGTTRGLWLTVLAAAMAGCAAAPPTATPRYDGPPGAYPTGAEDADPVGGSPDDPVEGSADSPAEGSIDESPGGWTDGTEDGADPAGEVAGEPGGAAVPDAELPGAELPDAEAGAADRGEPADGPVAEPAAERRPAGMTDFEAGVAAAASRLRRDPRWLLGALGRYRQHYRGRHMHLPGMDAAILTVEGVAAVDEAIAAGRRAKPRPGLRLSPGLSRAARAHARELGRAGTLEHDGRDGSQPHQRMGRHGRVIGLSGENIGTGWGDAEIMVIGLFVDDGVRGRGHRVNLLESEYRAIGVGCAPHKLYGTVCVLDFAGELRE